MIAELREALRGCEENLRLIHGAVGKVPEIAPMPSHSTFEAWHAATRALALLEQYDVVEGYAATGGVSGWEFAPTEGFTPGERSRPAILLVRKP